MTKDQEVIIQRIRSGTASSQDQAELYQGLLRFIRSIAERYKGGLKCEDEIDDLLQEGYFAMVAAASSWDPEAGSSFLNWLAFALHNRFREYVNRQYGIGRQPGERARKAANLEAEYKANYGFDPPLWLVAQELGVAPETLQKWRQMKNMVSLDAPVADDGTTMGDLLADPKQMEGQVIDRLIEKEVRRTLWRYIHELPPEMRDVVTYHFFSKMTDKRAAERLGISSGTFQSRLQSGIRRIATARHRAEIGKLLPERIGSSAYKNPSRSGSWRSSTERAAFYLLEHYDTNTNERRHHYEDN